MSSIWKRTSCVLVCSLFLYATARADAPAGRYMAGTGTVRDSKTGLTWEQPATTVLGWTDAKSYCKSKGTGWRLPTIKELLSLVDFGQTTSTSIDAIFPATQGDVYYWSATVVAGSPSSAWSVIFSGGYPFGNDMAGMNTVRCVR